MTHETAQAIVFKLLTDLNDRRGLRQEWEEIDDETQEEIERRWVQIVQETAGRHRQ